MGYAAHRLEAHSQGKIIWPCAVPWGGRSAGSGTKPKIRVVARQHVCCGKTRSLFWQDKMCVVARQDLCCGKARSLLCQDIREAALRAASTKGGGAFGANPLCGSLCLSTTDLVLPQQGSCLATTHILSCHNRDLVLPQH